MMKDDKLKAKIIGTITLVFTFNIIVLFIYCYFFLSSNLNTLVKTDKEELSLIFNTIKEEIHSVDEAKSFEKKYDIKIIIKDMESNTIYDDTDIEKYSYSISDIVDINDTKYLIHIYGVKNISIAIFVTSLLLLEILFALTIIIISYRVASRHFLKPIVNLRHDMINYQNGKIPTRRDPSTSIDELQNNFVSLTEALELEKEKKNEVIASISHDIKTPLTSIMGYASRLENANLTEEVKAKYIGKIALKSFDIKEIIDDFDDYLCTSFKGNLNFEEISIKDIISMVTNNYEEDLKEKGITLKVNNHAKKETVVVDIAKLRRVFSNVISNSIRYIKDKGIITISVYNDESFVEFEIADNGIGVDSKSLTKIFDPLYTTDASRKISGLGLSICRQIIKAHGGIIYAKNNKQGGLSIYFKVKKAK